MLAEFRLLDQRIKHVFEAHAAFSVPYIYLSIVGTPIFRMSLIV